MDRTRRVMRSANHGHKFGRGDQGRGEGGRGAGRIAARRVVALAVALVGLLSGPPRAAQADGLAAPVAAAASPIAAPASQVAAPFCQPGEAPQFRFGFLQLKQTLGPIMGDPVECEHPDSASGDTLLRTTTGLAFYPKSTNTPTFTDGHRHWALTGAGLVYWEGDAIDPPSAAQPAAEARPAAPAPPPAPGLSPTALYGALQTSPLARDVLPAGFSSPRVQPQAPAEGLAAYQVVGQVNVEVTGGGGAHLITYVVHSTDADALRFFQAPYVPTPTVTVTEIFAPPGFGQPVQCRAHAQRDPLLGVTACRVLVGNVLVIGVSTQPGANPRGNDANAIALAKAGVAHLANVQGRR